MSFIIRRGQSVRWKMRMTASSEPVNMAGGTWGIAETAFRILPTFEHGDEEAWLVCTPEQTSQMTIGRKRLRLKFTQANGQVKVFPDIMVAVQ